MKMLAPCDANRSGLDKIDDKRVIEDACEYFMARTLVTNTDKFPMMKRKFMQMINLMRFRLIIELVSPKLPRFGLYPLEE